MSNATKVRAYVEELLKLCRQLERDPDRAEAAPKDAPQADNGINGSAPVPDAEQPAGASAVLVPTGGPDSGWQCPGCKRCYGPGKWQCDYCIPSLKDRIRSS